jgi:hypothetical protein
MRYLLAFGRFWWDFLVGEDWRIAAGVAAVLGVGAVLVATTSISDAVLTIGTGAAVLVTVAASIVLPTIRSLRASPGREGAGREPG